MDEYLEITEIVKKADSTIRDCEKEIRIAEHYEKLLKSTAFRNVILKDYLENEPVVITKVKAHILSNPDELFKTREEILNQRLTAVSMFAAWLENIPNRKKEALETIENMNITKSQANEAQSDINKVEEENRYDQDSPLILNI